GLRALHPFLHDALPIYLRALLLPFSLLYGLAIWLRNRLYDWGWLRSVSFDRKIIVVGNLAVGGTGKSPMTEYLIRLLSSRGRLRSEEHTSELQSRENLV